MKLNLIGAYSPVAFLEMFFVKMSLIGYWRRLCQIWSNQGVFFLFFLFFFNHLKSKCGSRPKFWAERKSRQSETGVPDEHTPLSVAPPSLPPALLRLPFFPLFQINRVALIQCVSCRLPRRLFDPVFQSLPLGQTCFSSVCCTPALAATAATTAAATALIQTHLTVISSHCLFFHQFLSHFLPFLNPRPCPLARSASLRFPLRNLSSALVFRPPWGGALLGEKGSLTLVSHLSLSVSLSVIFLSVHLI